MNPMRGPRAHRKRRGAHPAIALVSGRRVIASVRGSRHGSDSDVESGFRLRRHEYGRFSYRN